MTATVLILVQDGPRTVAKVATYANDSTEGETFAESITSAAEVAARSANREIAEHLQKPSAPTH